MIAIENSRSADRLAVARMPGAMYASLPLNCPSRVVLSRTRPRHTES